MLAVIVLAVQLVYCRVPVPDIAHKVRQHGWALMAASAAIQLYDTQQTVRQSFQAPIARLLLDICGAQPVGKYVSDCTPSDLMSLGTAAPNCILEKSAEYAVATIALVKRLCFGLQTLELLVSVASLWLAGRWLRTSAPGLHRAVRLALAQQALAGAHRVVRTVGGGDPHLRSIYLTLEAVMTLLSTWRAWSAVLLLPVFGVAAQLLLANSVLEVRSSVDAHCGTQRRCGCSGIFRAAPLTHTPGQMYRDVLNLTSKLLRCSLLQECYVVF